MTKEGCYILWVAALKQVMKWMIDWHNEINQQNDVLRRLRSYFLHSFSLFSFLFSMLRAKKVPFPFKGAQSRFSHFERFSLNFSNSSFVIRVNLRHPWPFLFLYGLLLFLWCFSILVTYLFSGFLPFKGDFVRGHKKDKTPWLSSLNIRYTNFQGSFFNHGADFASPSPLNESSSS